MGKPADIAEAIETLRQNIHLSSAPASFFNVAQYLGESGDKHALQPLIEALQRGGTYIRSTSAIGLGYLGMKEAIPYLLDAFVHDPGLYVRCDAALALGLLRAEEALPVFLQRLPVEHFEVQKRIVTAITNIETTATRATLQEVAKLLQDLDISNERREFLLSLVNEGLKPGTT